MVVFHLFLLLVGPCGLLPSLKGKASFITKRKSKMSFNASFFAHILFFGRTRRQVFAMAMFAIMMKDANIVWQDYRIGDFVMRKLSCWEKRTLGVFMITSAFMCCWLLGVSSAVVSLAAFLHFFAKWFCAFSISLNIVEFCSTLMDLHTCIFTVWS